MKVKSRPDDFQVEELPTVEPGPKGRFVLYRLEKSGLGTFEALDAIRRRWNLGGRAVSYGGLKDRHAVTVQYLTILDGPERELRETSFVLQPLGRVAEPYGPAHFRGNRFGITIRSLGAEDVQRAEVAAESLTLDGVPNYFDDQRFGSVGFGGGFIARAWLKGDHEEAFRLALAEPNASDRPDSKAEKAILRENWGDWAAAKAKLERSHARSLVTYLVDHPTDFKGAFARIRRELRSIYFSAYQSHLWNLILGRLIEQNTCPEQREELDFKVARLPILRNLDAEQSATLQAARIPLPASRTVLGDDPISALAREVAAEQGLAWEDLRVKHLKDVFFSKGDRPAVFVPTDLRYETSGDELYKGRRKFKLWFELPKGAYATLVIKRLTDAARTDAE